MPEIDAEAIRNEFEAAVGRKPAGPPTYEVDEGSSIDHVIGVVSGKGGVGKSFVTGLLAIELARKGYAVGVLDADITGPSIPKMLGLSGAHAFAQNDLIIPVETAGGIKVMSATLVLEHEDEPVLWRGPILAGTLRQFFGETDWGKLDYLLVDMPPGTGDVPLTAFQSLPLEGVVIV
ncbi:MAG: P-loop NTPase, partial [Atopobiaceae bacterium]|nr:P-loop NTPase [Atopobiaceae bacterium]